MSWLVAALVAPTIWQGRRPQGQIAGVLPQVTAVWALENAVAEGTTRSVDEEDAILAGLKETLATLGLAHRVGGIPAEAEGAVS